MSASYRVSNSFRKYIVPAKNHYSSNLAQGKNVELTEIYDD